MSTNNPPYPITDPSIWQPCHTPMESVGDDRVALDFNFWMCHRYISDAEVHDFICSVLLGCHQDEFLEHSPYRTNRALVIAVHGMGPVELSQNIANGRLPFLSSFSSVPVRHSLSSSSRYLPHTKNISIPENSWWHSDIAPMNALILWPMVPAVRFADVQGFGRNLLDLFTRFVIVFKTEQPLWQGEYVFIQYSDALQEAKRRESFRISSALWSSMRETDICGKIKRSCGHYIEHGVYILRIDKETSNTLVYVHMLHSGLAETYTCIVSDDDTLTGNGTPLALKLCQFSTGDSEDIDDNTVRCDEVMRLVDVRNYRYHAVLWDLYFNEGSCSSLEDDEEGLVSSSEKVQPNVENNNVARVSETRNCETRNTGHGGIKRKVDRISECNTPEMKRRRSSSNFIEETIKESTGGKDHWQYLRELYQKCEECGALESMVAGAICREMMGYPELTGSNDMRFDTSSEEWIRLVAEAQQRNQNAVTTVQREEINKEVEVRSEHLLQYILEEPEEGEEVETSPEESDLDTNHSNFNLEVKVNVDIETAIQQKSLEFPVPDCAVVCADTVVKSRHASGVLKVCAIDCEMCSTSAGIELTRISLICPVEGIVLDELVKPKRSIVNYNTKYSGITEIMLEKVVTTIEDIHQMLPSFIGPETILVGHSLESDFCALGLIHHRVIDTAAVFPHPSGLPYKLSLRVLAQEYLHKYIQVGALDDTGHDSVEDASTALELALKYALQDYKSTLPSPWAGKSDTEQRYTLFHMLSPSSCHFGHSVLLSDIYTADMVSTKDKVDRISISVCNWVPHCDLPPWERHALGFKSESSFEIAYEQFLSDPYVDTIDKDRLTVNIVHPKDMSSVVNGVTAFARNSTDHDASLLWVDIPYDESPSETDIDERLCKGPEQLDAAIRDMYSSISGGTIVAVITQGNLGQVRQLLARKQRRRWKAAAMKAVNAPVYMQQPAAWTAEDEEQLIKATADVISGAMFLKYR